MTVAVFDYATWSARYPSLACVTSSATATAMFQDATLYLSNDDCSVVVDAGQRLQLLNMLVAHLATLEARSAAAGATGGFVGILQRATEGSVTVEGSQYPVGSGKWFEQTQPGAAYWQATLPYRQGRYQSGPRYITGAPQPWAPGYTGGYYGRRRW